jgi:hypothetical protein
MSKGQPLATMEAPTLTGDTGQDTYTALVTFATREGLTVTTHDPKTDGDDSRSTYHGYYSPGRKLIFVKQAAPAQMLKTFIHELGHHLDPELELAPRGEAETVAEATAFVVAACSATGSSVRYGHISTGFRHRLDLSRVVGGQRRQPLRVNTLETAFVLLKRAPCLVLGPGNVVETGGSTHGYQLARPKVRVRAR